MPMVDKHSFGEKVSSPKFQVQWGLVYVTVYQIISMKSVKILFSCVQFFVTPWTTAHQTPLSMEFSSQDTEMSCHSLFQGIFQPRDQTQVCCTADGLFTS